LESKVEWLYSEDSKLRREARKCGSFGVLNTSQPYASSRSRDAKFTSEAAERNSYCLDPAIIIIITSLKIISLYLLNKN
jgi:hypothetical protein